MSSGLSVTDNNDNKADIYQSYVLGAKNYTMALTYISI